MSHFICLIFVAILSLMLGVCSPDSRAEAPRGAEASSGAEGMPGAKGVFDFKPNDWAAKKTSWWKDSDGVNPGVAGCHIGTNDKGEPNGRMFGEACLPDGLLVESNPGKNELHSHSNDTGHPDTFDCNAWCVGKGQKSGMCEVAPAPPCEQSALCVCLG